jgi:adenosylcobinamide-phosphate synthase
MAAGGRVLKRIAPLALALLIDSVYGELPAQFHPVVWMGRLLEWLEARAPQHETGRLIYGIGVALAVPLGWAGLARALERFAPWPLLALALKPSAAVVGTHLHGLLERPEPRDALVHALAETRGYT